MLVKNQLFEEIIQACKLKDTRVGKKDFLPPTSF